MDKFVVVLCSMLLFIPATTQAAITEDDLAKLFNEVHVKVTPHSYTNSVGTVASGKRVYMRYQHVSGEHRCHYLTLPEAYEKAPIQIKFSNLLSYLLLTRGEYITIAKGSPEWTACFGDLPTVVVTHHVLQNWQCRSSDNTRPVYDYTLFMTRGVVKEIGRGVCGVTPCSAEIVRKTTYEYHQVPSIRGADGNPGIAICAPIK